MVAGGDGRGSKRAGNPGVAGKVTGEMKNAALFLVRRGVGEWGWQEGLRRGEDGGAGADGGPMGLGNGGTDVLDALRAEDGTEAAGGG